MSTEDMKGEDNISVDIRNRKDERERNAGDENFFPELKPKSGFRS